MDYKLHTNKGLWHVNFYVADAKGKKRRKQLSTGIKAYDKYGREINKKLADAKAKEIVARFDGIVDNDFSTWTLDKCVKYCLESNKTKISPTTYNDYVSAINKHITPYFKNGKPLKDMKARDIEVFNEYKLNQGLSPKTVHKLLSLIGPAFRYAEKNDYIIKNPMRVVDRPSKVKKEGCYYNAAQLNTLAHVAKGSYIETPVVLAMVLGLRRSEIVGITWDNVDFNKRLLYIKQSVIMGDSRILPHGTYKVIGHTNSLKPKDIILKYFLKTESSERSFTINDALYNYLKALKSKQETMMRETNEYKDFLCVNPVGALITPDSITHQFTKLLDENELPHIRFHELRHSCISLLANNNAFSMKQIQDYAGHSDFLTTFNVYSHTDDSAKKTEMDYITSCFSDLFGTDKEE